MKVEWAVSTTYLESKLKMARLVIGMLVWFALSASSTAWAQEGMIEINQAAVEAGGISAGDTPGFPATLSESGSYRLTGNLTVAADVNAIEVSADHVTIDFMGFGIFGPNDCSSFPCTYPSGRPAVWVRSENVTIKNGVISGARGRGIATNSPLVRIESMRILSSGLDGIFIGSRGSVMNNSLIGNGGMGLNILGQGTIYSGNVIAGNFGGAVSGGRALSGNHCDDGTCSHVAARQFLKSHTQGAGDQAATACPTGFHMASLFEIIDPSAFQYAGRISGDMGGGPSTSLPAWIRTGSTSSGTADMVGSANCDIWTSGSSEHHGTAASLSWDPGVTLERFPWNTVAFTCDRVLPTWCVED